MIPKWSQKQSRSGPRDISKEKQQNFSKVNQEAPKVDQKVLQNDPKKDFGITKNGLGGKTMIIWKVYFLVFWLPWEVSDRENQAKTL